MSVLQGRVHLGGALSGRDIEAVNKTVSGLAKLLFPDPEMPVSDEDLEWIVRLALEARRRVKEQQKRVLQERVPQHPLQLHPRAGGRRAVRLDARAAQRRGDRDATPCRRGRSGRSARAPARPARASTASRSPAARAAASRILNQPTPPPFRESVKVGEQNLYTRAKELVGDRNPREDEFSIQMRAMDADKAGVGPRPSRCWSRCAASLLERNTRGGTIVVGALNLGGSVELIPNAVRIAELAIDKQAQTFLMPVAARRQLNDLPDELWTKISIEFYATRRTRCSRRWWSSDPLEEVIVWQVLIGAAIALVSALLGALIPVSYAHRQYVLAERRRAAEYLLDWLHTTKTRLQDLTVWKQVRLETEETDEQAMRYSENKRALRDLLLSPRPSFVAFLAFGDGPELELTKRLQAELLAANRVLVNAREDWPDAIRAVERRFVEAIDPMMSELVERLAQRGRLPESVRLALTQRGDV